MGTNEQGVVSADGEIADNDPQGDNNSEAVMLRQSLSMF